MTDGILRIQTYAARLSAPVPEVEIAVTGDGFSRIFSTEENGTAADLRVPAPDKALSLTENAGAIPYAVVTVIARKAGYRTVTTEDVQIFPGQVTLMQTEMIPAGGEAAAIPPETTVVPPHALYAGCGGSGPAPAVSGRVLGKVVVPSRITVHLGKPAASAQNVTVGFQDYIANVASSEVYPTWPEEALRANIHAQISLALNRVYTEWYPSKGYTFHITNSTRNEFRIYVIKKVTQIRNISSGSPSLLFLLSGYPALLPPVFSLRAVGVPARV
jgi:hypothetical protein